MSKRPERLAPPEVYYNETEAKKYTQSSRMIEIQEQMSERAIELLMLPEDQSCLLLDIGCGSGLSGSVLEDKGHTWIGVDISSAMLDIAKEREIDGDLILGDMGQGLPFRAGIFDGAVSISALQWLCYADKTSHNPVKRLYSFFSSLFACLSRNARAVLQFYPENSDQVELITAQATKAGFFGGVLVDYPNSTKAKKMFLVLMTGGAAPLPKALGTESEDRQTIANSKREYIKQARGKSLKKSREWILEKKERRRRQGNQVRADTKYTGRKRSGRF
ncbi:probable 18S rRNA (guanine-N(7))-methyltransferase [Pseudomyrmex gracilis]|uniref:probable 18S rRNA (guanine-N(7))-methyltransferase n=1 Tax=Pseudomyrmex gracilis TaxID=219809 RepID=UPI0009950781|nr:probable 18S rRNA (guanine-N(7))-methyltransferase [Pseudomyrmex gracilis]XP_020288885.1 probable 18S rRNA (guanine-N(7))-methyltransferase [Pseudomyrmex gracilis]XP_020288886.1 probable 18S rRNA (guanine-N(7))-methyltransferase [Pseudomyrmex gracilis]XP_020288887.1 probable 18S rRNA (guanine-N(7))-methyltransferase [Pseudomyrmex gracilis]